MIRVLVIISQAILAGYTFVDTEANLTDCQFIWSLVQVLINAFQVGRTLYDYLNVLRSMDKTDIYIRNKVGHKIEHALCLP